MGQLNLSLLFAVFMTSAVLGDAVNYAIGNKLGRWTFALTATPADQQDLQCASSWIFCHQDASACACCYAMCVCGRQLMDRVQL
jgi:membrane protein DedA with SNARE-associated domain